jgi:hypothetical protein
VYEKGWHDKLSYGGVSTIFFFLGGGVLIEVGVDVVYPGWVHIYAPF